MLTVLSLALLPVAALIIYIYRKDMVQPEPISALIKAVFFGVLSVPVAIIIDLLLPQADMTSLGGALYNAFISAGLVEELSKFLFLLLLIRTTKAFDEPFDGIVYATCIGLGFAGLENIMYLAGADDMISTALMRDTFSVPGHFCFQAVMGYYVAKAVFGPQAKRNKNYMLAVAVPVAMHGIFDALLMVAEAMEMGLLVLLWIPFCIWMFIKVARLAKAMRAPVMPVMPPPLYDDQQMPPQPPSFNN